MLASAQAPVLGTTSIPTASIVPGGGIAMEPVRQGSLIAVPPGTTVPVNVNGSIVHVKTVPAPQTASVRVSNPVPKGNNLGNVPTIITLPPKYIKTQLPPKYNTETLPEKIIQQKLPPLGPPALAPKLSIPTQSVVVPSTQSVVVPPPQPVVVPSTQSVVVPPPQPVVVPSTQSVVVPPPQPILQSAVVPQASAVTSQIIGYAPIYATTPIKTNPYA